MFRHTGQKPFKCDVCDYAVAWRFKLKQHKRVKHSSVVEQKQSHKCDVCGSEFSSLSELTLHRTQQHNTAAHESYQLVFADVVTGQSSVSREQPLVANYVDAFVHADTESTADCLDDMAVSYDMVV